MEAEAYSHEVIAFGFWPGDDDDPRATLLAFCQSAYLAGARTAGWDVNDLATRVAPT